jgi:hypothetical protein
MADGGIAGQLLDRADAGEVVADKAETALGIEPVSVEGDDARGFLAAMLQGVQAEGGDRGGVGVVVDAEDAALLAQPISVDIEAFDIGSATRAVR